MFFQRQMLYGITCSNLLVQKALTGQRNLQNFYALPKKGHIFIHLKIHNIYTYILIIKLKWNYK